MSKIYQEGKDSTFTHQKKVYSLDVLFRASAHRRPHQFKIDLLDWVLEYTTVDEERVEAADISVPVLVFFDQRLEHWVVIDGAHRLTKAVRLKKTHLPALVISQPEMHSAYLHDSDGKHRGPLYAEW
jgi:hypothetical protein